MRPRCGQDRVPDVRGDARRGDAEVAPTCQVREVFTLTLNRKDRKDGFSKFTNVAGARVVSGEVRVRDRIRLWRGGEAVYDGTLASLKHFKEEVRARSRAVRARKRTVPGADAVLTWPPRVSQVRMVAKGSECGMVLHDHGDVQAGDVISVYEIVARKPSLYDAIADDKPAAMAGAARAAASGSSVAGAGRGDGSGGARRAARPPDG